MFIYLQTQGYKNFKDCLSDNSEKLFLFKEYLGKKCGTKILQSNEFLF
jgi:hypothetical protein